MNFKQYFFLLVLIFAGQQIQARQVLAGIDLSEGNWELVGVSLANHQLVPLQMDLGTFIVRESHVLDKMKATWDLEEKFEDYCDYHYALKFYKNGELEKTVRLNLVCNYLTVDGLSFAFTEDDLTQFRMYFRPIRWSRIRFRDLDLLQQSVDILEQADDVYWYGDVQQYTFDGEFSITVNDLPWNANRDSVIAELTADFEERYGRDDFYITTKYWLLSDDFETMTLRLNVFCQESFFRKYAGNNVITRWRNHFSEQSFVQLMVIGMSQKEYYQFMRQG